MTEIWHTPRCSKSRETLALLEDRGLTATVRRYLEDAPTEAELRAVLDMLGLPPSGLLRKGEAIAKDMGLKDAAEDAILAAMVAQPVLIERPVVIHNGRARIGRPPEAVLELF